MKLTKTVIDPEKLNKWDFKPCPLDQRDKVTNAIHNDASRTNRKLGTNIKAKTLWMPDGVWFKYHKARSKKQPLTKGTA
jgi:hypothetical protein